jgi:hypothetical protein
MTEKELVEKFQCPGCVCGSDTKCGKYNYNSNDRRCISHVLGTSFGLNNNVALGLPKGFNKPGFNGKTTKNTMDICLWVKGSYDGWDHLNVPVWAMEQDGFLFVRTFAPRINCSWVDVIEGGDLSLCPSAINVKDFIDSID